MTFQQFTSPAFWHSFRSLANVKGLSVADKMNLVRLDKYMKDEIEVARNSNDGNEESLAAIMAQEVDFKVEFDFDLESLAEHLTATDLINLQPLLNKEDV
jgi:hypothetical protein